MAASPGQFASLSAPGNAAEGQAMFDWEGILQTIGSGWTGDGTLETGMESLPWERRPSRVTVVGESEARPDSRRLELAGLRRRGKAPVLGGARTEVSRGELQRRRISLLHAASLFGGHVEDVVLKNTTPRFVVNTFESAYDSTDSVELLNEGDERWANYFKVAFQRPALAPADAVLDAGNAKRPAKIDGAGRRHHPAREQLELECGHDYVQQHCGARGVWRARAHRPQGDGRVCSRRACHRARPITPLSLSNSLVVSDKKVTGPVNYNLRVVETRMAARALANYLGLAAAKDNACRDLRGVLETYFAENGGAGPTAGRDGEQQRGQADARALGRRGGAHQGARGEGGCAVLVGRTAGGRCARRSGEADRLQRRTRLDAEFLSSFPIRADAFQLYRRSKHVFTEALRVLQFQALCKQNSTESAKEVYTQAGQPHGRLAEVAARAVQLQLRRAQPDHRHCQAQRQSRQPTHGCRLGRMYRPPCAQTQGRGVHLGHCARSTTPKNSPSSPEHSSKTLASTHSPPAVRACTRYRP
ncbi:hypothetical protein L1887_54128 [Cichorium endivia]|nr:hypothetical protein L1887_54128 [Cichorium endivia]